MVSLFTNRGWSTFASDRLVFRVLYFANLGVAILSGGAACLADVVAGPFLPPEQSLDSSVGGANDADQDLSASRWVAFLIGFLLGATISHTALFVIESAVRTVIVCFAESPAEFQECHPVLCQLMKDGWAEAYPEQWAECPIVWAAPARGSDLSGQVKVATATAAVVITDEPRSSVAFDWPHKNAIGALACQGAVHIVSVDPFFAIPDHGYMIPASINGERHV